jgi:hypothetical protein
MSHQLAMRWRQEHLSKRAKAEITRRLVDLDVRKTYDVRKHSQKHDQDNENKKNVVVQDLEHATAARGLSFFGAACAGVLSTHCLISET